MSDLTSHMEAFTKAIIAEDIKWLLANSIESSDEIEERHDLYDPDGFTLSAFQWRDDDCFKLTAHGICQWAKDGKTGWDHRLTLEHNHSAVMTTKYVLSETHIKQINWLKRKMDLVEATVKIITGSQLLDEW